MSGRFVNRLPAPGGRAAARVLERVCRCELYVVVVFTLMLALFAPQPAHSARRRMPYYHLDRVRGNVEMSLGHDKTARTTTGSPDLDESELLVEQALSLGGTGWLYHPALLQLDADFTALFEQDFLDVKDARGNDTYSRQLNYDIGAELLPYKSYPTHYSVSQHRSQIASPFAPRQVVDSFQAGVGINLHRLALAGRGFPTKASYHYHTTDSHTFSVVDPSTLRRRNEFDFVTNSDTDTSRNRFRYNWRSTETATGPLRTLYGRHDVRFSQWRSLDRGSLSSEMLFTDTTGSFDSRSAAVSESLNLSHAHSLSSNYSYGLSFQDATSSQQLSNHGSIGLSHHLYESLGSNVRTSGSYSNSDLGRTWTAGGSGGLDYHKRIPGGALGLRFSPNYIYTKEDVESGQLSVLDERHSIRFAGQEIDLNRLLIDRSTIVVRDPVDLRSFVEGSDYRVIDHGVATRLEIVPNGGLDPNSPTIPPPPSVITVAYDYRTEPARTFSTLSLAENFTLQLWDHLNVEVSHTTTEQRLIEGIEDQFSLDDSRRLIGRIELRYARSTTRFEYERYWATITPRERYSVSEGLNFRPTASSVLAVGAAYDRDRLTDTNRLTQALSLNASGTSRLPFSLYGRLNLLFRWVDQAEQTSLATTGDLSLLYRYGRLHFELRDRVSWRRTDSKLGRSVAIREILNTVYFSVRRPF